MNLILPYLASGWRRRAARLMLITFVAALCSCSHTPTPVVTTPTPLYQVQPETWRAIDEQILRASVYAMHESMAYARVAMEDWLWRVRRHTEDVFIPWYSHYWTQQWMATRVAWYKLQYTEGEVTPEERLLSYLQQQFYEQVLEPVNNFVDPHTIMEETTARYLQELKKRLEPLPFEYRIPVAALNQHLKFIPAIVIPVMPLQDISLFEVLQATDLSALPAYETLLAQIAAINGGVGPTSSTDGLDRVASRAVTELVEQMALRGGASAASIIMGGYWGVLISAGSMTWSAIDHANHKPEMEAQLRDNLDVMLDVIWQGLVEDPQGGVTAVVQHMNNQIEYAVFTIDPAGTGLF